MKLIILAGAGVGENFYKDTIKVLKSSYDVELFLSVGKSLSHIAETIYKKLSCIQEDFLLVGHCFGGNVAVSILSSYNLKHLKGAVLINSCANTTILKSKAFIFSCNESLDTYKTLSQEVKEGVLDGDTTSSQLDIVLKTDLRDRLSDINVPALIIGSDHDGYFKQDRFIELSNSIKNSRLYLIRNARHLAFLTHSEEVKNIINITKKNSK